MRLNIYFPGDIRKNKMEIRVRGLRKTFVRGNQDPLVVLDGIDFKVEHGQFVAIIGPSGCGKTTLLKIIAGIEKADDGKIEFEPNSRGGAFPIVWQEHRLFPWRTVMRNIAFPLELKNIEYSKAEEKVRSLVQLMGLSNFESYYTWQLSSGMAQRVAIARALATDSDCLLMDEPFASVDYQTKQILFQKLLELHKNRELTILYVTHDIRDAIRFSNYIIVLTQRPSKVREVIRLAETDFQEAVLERRIWNLLK